jgi:hypothetical protein
VHGGLAAFVVALDARELPERSVAGSVAEQDVHCQCAAGDHDDVEVAVMIEVRNVESERAGCDGKSHLVTKGARLRSRAKC